MDKKYINTQYIIATEDWDWTKDVLSKVSVSYDIIRSENHTVGEDMALLSSCDAVIMSIGSFGWWAGWFSNKPTIYYNNWPRNGTRFPQEFLK